MVQLTDRQQIQEDSFYFPYHYLDLKAEEYQLILHFEYVNRLKTVKQLLHPFQGQLILDAGCGDGRFCFELSKENVRAIGVDYSERALAFARAFNPTVEFHAQDLSRLSLPYRFKAIVLLEALEHFRPAVIPVILKNLADHLEPNGQLIVTVPSVNIPLIDKHYQHFSEASLRQTLQDYFTVTRCFGHSRTRGGIHTKPFWIVRRISTWFYPFRIYTRLVPRWLRAINRYYENHLAIGLPSECSGLVVVCTKR